MTALRLILACAGGVAAAAGTGALGGVAERHALRLGARRQLQGAAFQTAPQCHGEWYGESKSSVQQLCASNFPTTGTWFVEFYAPWCGHCQDFRPVWTGFAKDVGPELGKVGAVDCTRNEALCKQVGITYYPTVLGLHGGSWHEANSEQHDNLAPWASSVVSGQAETLTFAASKHTSANVCLRSEAPALDKEHA
mmetsp:Transcript_103401/g.291941  ORF Transcript_103401/g.291941 Transcript_103401/m.291941 type:complete len:194 (+) Transcript_103401:100-681(+)